MSKSTGKSRKEPVTGILILAAGQGKRMKSPLPKVLHDLGGVPMLFHLLYSIKHAAPKARIGLVVGHGRELVEKAVREAADFQDLAIEFILQPEARGTGHAARCGMDSAWGQSLVAQGGQVLVFPGDLPLIPAALVTALSAPLAKGEALRLLTTELADPTGYGRVIRKGKGSAKKITEEKDATAAERKIREVAASIYAFDAAFLAKALKGLKTKNAQNEYYLTDVIETASKGGKKTPILEWVEAGDLRGVNDLWELSQAESILNMRTIRHWAREGVRFTDPSSTVIESSVTIGEGVKIHRGCVLRGTTRIGRGAEIGSNVVLRNTEVGEGANVKAGVYSESSSIGAGASVGPYAHLRPESVVGPKAKVGNFVELKKATIGEGSSVAHLSYLGDATVGAGANIGCGFVTCNYDGFAKHRTVIGDGAFVGSDCQAVAPLTIGAGAYVASGTTLTQDVPADALAIARARQENKPGYASRLRARLAQKKQDR